MRRLIPLAVAVMASCIADENSPGGAAGLVTVFDSTGDTIFARIEGQVPVSALRSMTRVMQIAPAADDTSLFVQIGEVDVDMANRVWLFDDQSNQLFLFDSAGTLVRRIGRQGQGPGEFAGGGGLVTLPDTGAALWDAQNARISFFTANGDFRTSWPVPAGFATNNGLLTDTSGTLYLRRPVSSPREVEVIGRLGLVSLGEGGVFQDSLVPVDLPVERDTYVAVSPDGRSRTGTSSRLAPNYYWDWHPEGYFVVGHGGRYEIILERRPARPVVIRRSAPAVPIVPDERAEEKERILWTMRRTQPNWSWTGRDIPEIRAPLAGITVTRDGNIWSSVATPSERIPDSELPPQRENGIPIRHYRLPVVYEVFAPDGRFLGRVPMPPRTTMFQADGNYFWGVTRDEDNLPSIVRFRLSASFHPDR